MTNKLNTNPYKGTRDFYPEDKRIQNYIFSIMRKTTESFGYEEYDAPILEEKALYAAKSGEELVNEQSYTFTDRGGREVMLRPEMTPTLARMVAAKRNELVFPIRWYSIPNLWRYENPQRGRVREHWQLNVDMYGINSIAADFEIISIAEKIMTAYGANAEMYRIRVNNRRLMNSLFRDVLGLDNTGCYRVSKAIDKKAKIDENNFAALIQEFLTSEKTEKLNAFLNARNISEIEAVDERLRASAGLSEMSELLSLAKNTDLENVMTFDPTIMRGLDYYTGTVFEVFDLSPENTRSIFGGGRYDNLLSEFGEKDLSGVGFGMGDVTIRDFLTTHKLLSPPESKNQVYVTVFDYSLRNESAKIAEEARIAGLNVVLETENIRLEKQLKYADKKQYALAIIIGTEEAMTKEVVIKNLKKRTERKVKREGFIQGITEELKSS